MGIPEICESELTEESVSLLEGVFGEIGVEGGGGADVDGEVGSVSSIANTSYASSTEGKRGSGFF